MQISLTKLPWYAQIGAFVVLALAGIAAFYSYYEAPTRADMAARQSQLLALRADINKGYATAKRLPEFRSQVAELESRLENLNAVLPSEKDAADLLRRLQTVAVQSNLTIKGFKPSPPSTNRCTPSGRLRSSSTAPTTTSRPSSIGSGSSRASSTSARST